MVSLRTSLFLFVTFIILALLGGAYFASTAPPLPQPQCAEIVGVMDVLKGKLVREPKKSILDLWTCFREYKKENWMYTTIGIWGTYATFKVFGPLGAGTSMVLTVLIGALYEEWQVPYLEYSLLAHVIGFTGEVFGGAGGFIMSGAIGRPILERFMKEKLDSIKAKMDEHGNNFRYMLFLRTSPLFPNWFVNYATALIAMPFSYFVIASTLAIQPATFMSISMGKLLRDAGEQGLDLGKMAKQGTMMALIMMVLSLSLLPADDYKAVFAKFKAKFSSNSEKAKST